MITRRRNIRRSTDARTFGLLRHEGGASAIEFALLAPVLAVSLLAAADLGLAVYDRMTLDNIVRSGAQSAMGDPGKDSVLKVLQTIASENFAIAGSTTQAPGKELVSLTVDRSCACPESANVSVSCSTVCSGSAPASAYYKLSGSKSRKTIIMPPMNLRAAIQVQVR